MHTVIHHDENHRSLKKNGLFAFYIWPPNAWALLEVQDMRAIQGLSLQ
jgi:hypothetical protein